MKVWVRLLGIIHLVRTEHFPNILHFLHPDTHVYGFISEGKKCSFFWKFCVLTKWIIPYWLFKRVTHLSLPLVIHGQLMSCVINGHFAVGNNTGLQNVRYHKLFYMSNRIFFIPSHQDIFYRMTRLWEILRFTVKFVFSKIQLRPSRWVMASFVSDIVLVCL